MAPVVRVAQGHWEKPVLKSFLLFINLLGRIAGLVRRCSWPWRRSFSGRCEPKAVDRNERGIAGQAFKILLSPGGASARRGGRIIAGLCRSAVARGRSPRPRLTSPSSCGMVAREKSIPAGPGAGRVQQLDSPEGSASGPGRRPGFWPAPRVSVVLSGF